MSFGNKKRKTVSEEEFDDNHTSEGSDNTDDEEEIELKEELNELSEEDGNSEPKNSDSSDSDAKENGVDCDFGTNDNDELNKENNKIKENPAWADAMAKILKTNKPKRKKTIVLAKAKKIRLVSDNSDNNNENIETFEIEEKSDKKSEVKLENKFDEINEGRKVKAQLEMARRIRKKAIEAKGRVKTSIIDKDREKVLVKVATKGIVQLFNAVRQQQKSLDKEIEKVGPSDAKKDKVLRSVDKRAFLDVLMGAKSQAVPKMKDEPEAKSEWSVLRDDFMMSTKLKDWDKDENEELKDELNTFV